MLTRVLFAISTLMAMWPIAPQTPRDAARVATAADTGQISGAVHTVSGAANAEPQPARRAIVTLTSDALRNARSVITDDDGRFSADGLPAGRYAITATKPAYLSSAYGATRPGRPGVPLVLAAGQKLASVSITLTRGAVISGTLRDAKGAPLVAVYAFAYRVNPDGSLGASQYVASDDRGRYRVFGLAAGDYLVVAQQESQFASNAADYGTSLVDKKLAALRARQPFPAGAAGQSTASTPAPAASATSFIAAVWYPHSFSAEDALRVRVAAGEERSGIDIAMDRSHTANVDGSVTGAAPNQPLTYSLRISGARMANPRGGPMQVQPPAQRTDIFRFTGVTPGRYTLIARTPPGAESPMFARTEIDVNGDDITGVALALQPALQLRGTIVFDGARAQPSDLTAIRAMLEDASPDSRPAGSRGGGPAPLGPVTTDANGHFVVDFVPSVYRGATSLAPDPNGWWPRSFIVDGRDILDAPIVLGSGAALTDAVLTFTDRHTTLSGALEVGAGAGAASDYYIVVFPEDRSQWIQRARRIRTARPGTDGTYVFNDLPPGTYRLAALTDVAPDDLIDAAFFDALLPASILVTIGDGESKTQSLRIGG